MQIGLTIPKLLLRTSLRGKPLLRLRDDCQSKESSIMIIASILLRNFRETQIETIPAPQTKWN